MRVLRRVMCLGAAALLIVPSLAMAQAAAAPGAGTEASGLALDLNKLEALPASGGAGAGCRAYLVATDPEGGPKLDALRLDLVLFGTDGVIARRIALDVGPIGPGRTQVRPFDLRDLACEGISQILVNDALICKVAGADQTDCLDRVRTSSRVSAKLVK
jgi:hypothetical protein